MPGFWSVLLFSMAIVAIPGLAFLAFGWITGLFNPQGWLGVPPLAGAAGGSETTLVARMLKYASVNMPKGWK